MKNKLKAVMLLLQSKYYIVVADDGRMSASCTSNNDAQDFIRTIVDGYKRAVQDKKCECNCKDVK